MVASRRAPMPPSHSIAAIISQFVACRELSLAGDSAHLDDRLDDRLDGRRPAAGASSAGNVPAPLAFVFTIDLS